MYSSVINIAILVNRAVLLELIISAPGLINPIVDEPTGEADPINISVINNSIFFFCNELYFFLFYSISFLTAFKKFSGSCFSVRYFRFLISSSLVLIFNNSGSLFKNWVCTRFLNRKY